MITDVISSSNAWIHASLFNDFIHSHITSYLCLKFFKVQINIQIYAFNFNVHYKNVFYFLKIITHLYHLIAQMWSLCWDYVNICNAFSVLFLSLISLIFVILHYCNVIACWNHYEEKDALFVSWLYFHIFLNKDIQKYYFLDDE